MMPVSEAIGESFRHTRLWNIWREVPEKQKAKVLHRWANNLLAAMDRLNGSTPVRKSVKILIEEVEDDITHRGGLERVWHDLKESEQQSLRRKWRGIFLKNLYSPDMAGTGENTHEQEKVLDAGGDGNSDPKLSDRSDGNAASAAAALEQKINSD